MRRVIACAVLAVGILSGMLFGNGNVAATSEKVWLDTPVVKVNEGAALSVPGITTHCLTPEQPITVEGWAEYRQACVFGDEGKTQVARYTNLSGMYLYAVKFPLDTKFFPVMDVCMNAAHCVYGQGSDVFLSQVQLQYGVGTALIEHFTTHLVKHSDDGIYYRLEYPGVYKLISLGLRTARTNALAVSPNGMWALVELESYGFVRVNLHTGEYKRVIAPGAEYGYGSNPSFELAITDDGSKMAIAGWGASLAIYEVDDACGDTLTDSSATTFSPYIYACRPASIDLYGLFPGFSAAYTPRFSGDGTQLTSYVYASQQLKKVTLTPSTLKTRRASEHTYVAFGDSFTSGEGESSDVFYLAATNTGENHCHVSTRSYPYLVGAMWNKSVINKACSGSRTADVRKVSYQTAQQTDPSEVPNYISIGVGGNDIDLMGKLKTCIGIGTCEWATLEKRQASRDEIRAVFPNVVRLINDVQSDNPKAQIAIIGYPSMVNTDTNASCDPLIAMLLSREERQYMDESVLYLNAMIKAAATYTGVQYIDTERALVGERLCDPITSAVNSLRLGDDIAPIAALGNVKMIGAESFHPTPRGHQLMAEAIKTATGNDWRSGVSCEGCVVGGAQLAAPSYWNSTNEMPVAAQHSELFLSKSEVAKGDAVSFHFPVGYFAAGSRVTLELHSTPEKLAEYTAKEDGSLEGWVTIPETAGYHSLHALGTTFSGEAIDAYETIAISTVVDATVKPVVQRTTVSMPFVTLSQVRSPIFHSVTTGSEAAVKGVASTLALKVIASTSPPVTTDFSHTINPTLLGWVGATVAGVGIMGSASALLYRKRKTKPER